MRDGKSDAVDADIGTYFCGPALFPRQRPTYEDPTGLLRQYFREGSDLSAHSAIDELVAAKRKERPPSDSSSYCLEQVMHPGLDDAEQYRGMPAVARRLSRERNCVACS